MKVKCVNCGTTWSLSDPSVGKVLKCGKCGTKFVLEVVRYLDEPVNSVEPSKPRSVTPQAASPMDELITATKQPAHGYRPARTTRYRSGSSYRKGIPKWIIPVAVVVVLGVGLLIVWRTGLLSRVGLPSGTTDIRKVISNPEAYAGRTLVSRAICEGSGYYRGIGVTGGMPLILMTSPQMEEKEMKIAMAVGEHQSVMIKYRIHDKAMFAKIKAKEKAEDRAAEAAVKAERARGGTAELSELPPGVVLDPGPDASPQVRAAYEARRQKDAEAEAAAKEEVNDPMDYQGILIDIWIP